MTRHGEPLVWPGLPLGEPRPFAHDHQGLRYLGEVVRADSWLPRWGEPLLGELFFRIVLLTQGQSDRWPALRDPRIAVCLPSPGTLTDGKSASIQEARGTYTAVRDAEGELIRRMLQRHRRGLEEQLMAEESARYAAGKVLTAHPTPPNPVTLFSGVDSALWFTRLADWLLSQAYPNLPIDAAALPRPVTGDDAAQLHRAISGQPGAPTSILADLGPGLGLSFPTRPASFDPSACRVFELIRRRLSSQPAPAQWAEVYHHLTHEVGLIGPLATLYLLTFLRWDQPELEVRLLPGHQFALLEGRRLPGNRLTGDLAPLLLWDHRLAEWGSTIGPATPPDWNDVLPYLSVLSPGLRPATEGEDCRPQETALLASTAAMADTVARGQEFLERLGWSKVDAQAAGPAQSLGRLFRLRGEDFQSVYRSARSIYPDYRPLAEDLTALGRLSQLMESAAEVLAAQQYVEGAVAPPGMPELSVERQALRAVLAPGALLGATRSWSALAQQVSGFRSRYLAAYLGHHQGMQRELLPYRRYLEEAHLKLRALAFLNTLPELGEPAGVGLTEALDRLGEVPPCCSVSAADLDLRSNPWCSFCRLTLEQKLPAEQLAGLLPAIEAALAQQTQRLSVLLVQKVLRRQGDGRLDEFLKIVHSSDLSALSNTLSDELLAFIRELLA